MIIAAGRPVHPVTLIFPVDRCIAGLHVLPAAAGLHLLPRRLHRRQQRALGGGARHLLHVQPGLLDVSLTLARSAAPGSDDSNPSSHL